MSIAISSLPQINVVLHSKCALVHSYVKNKTRKNTCMYIPLSLRLKGLIKTLISLSFQLHNITS